MGKDYIKVPVVIQAAKWDGLNKEEIENFVGKDLAIEQESDAAYQVGMAPPIFSLIIPTLEGGYDSKSRRLYHQRSKWRVLSLQTLYIQKNL